MTERSPKQDVISAKGVLRALQIVIDKANTLQMHYGYYLGDLECAAATLKQGIEYNERLNAESDALEADRKRERETMMAENRRLRREAREAAVAAWNEGKLLRDADTVLARIRSEAGSVTLTAGEPLDVEPAAADRVASPVASANGIVADAEIPAMASEAHLDQIRRVVTPDVPRGYSVSVTGGLVPNLFHGYYREQRPLTLHFDQTVDLEMVNALDRIGTGVLYWAQGHEVTFYDMTETHRENLQAYLNEYRGCAYVVLEK